MLNGRFRGVWGTYGCPIAFEDDSQGLPGSEWRRPAGRRPVGRPRRTGRYPWPCCDLALKAALRASLATVRSVWSSPTVSSTRAV